MSQTLRQRAIDGLPPRAAAFLDALMKTNVLDTPTPPRAVSRAGFLLGFALSGFFDGILLHQILQWHHLLSGVDRDRLRDLTVQVLADGVFHLLMYLIAAIGLWQLWKARAYLADAVSGRRLLAMALLGFGTWHIADGILSHWILGIHRIRMDSDMPLFWDLLWFTLFGVVFAVIGWRLRKPQAAGSGSAGYGPLTAWVLAIAAAIGGPVAALPPPGSSAALVFFRPGTAPVTIFDGLEATDARIIWSDAAKGVWALDFPDRKAAKRLYGHGAFLVSSSAIVAGCLASTKVRP